MLACERVISALMRVVEAALSARRHYRSFALEAARHRHTTRETRLDYLVALLYA